MGTQHAKFVQLLALNQPLFNALGDMHRQRILFLLACGEMLSVEQVAERTELSRPAVSHHIKILKTAGLLVEKRKGVRRCYEPNFDSHIASMKALVDEAIKLHKQKSKEK